jgi:histone acetyltransferase MYST2
MEDVPSIEATDHQTSQEDRETDLKAFASEWDLKLFREAQSLAAEDVEASLKGLPDSRSIKYIEMGRNEMEVWYQSPYPDEYTCLPRIYVCEFCLKYMKSKIVLKRHAAKCVWSHPPGDEIYRKDKLSVFEICGKRYLLIYIVFL